MTLHMLLAQGDNLTDNTLVVTWSWAWAHSFILILCEKLDASFIFTQTFPPAQIHSVNMKTLVNPWGNLLLSSEVVTIGQTMFPRKV